MQANRIHLSLMVILMLASLSLATRSRRDNDQQKVNVRVLYESLCPDSKNFWINQLAPTFASLNSIMDIEPVAFGHSMIRDDNSMECQHGQQECTGNRIHACIIDMVQTQQQFVEAIDCIFKNYRRADWTAIAKRCVEEKTNLTWPDVYNKCAMQQKGYDLMRKNSNTTNEVGYLGYVPKIIIDGDARVEVQDEAEFGLAQYVCKVFKGPNRPQSCPTSL